MTFSLVNLPSVTALTTALRSLENNAPSTGAVILKMDKTGHWVYGADQTEVEDGATWAVNPFSFIHGFIAWGDGDVLGEKMVAVTSPLPEVDAAPAGAKRGWETQVGMSLKCQSGEDEGLEVRFSTTSVGGKRAVQALAVAIATQVDADQSTPVPVITLGKEHYQHKSYGRIYTPIFDISKWASMEGAVADAPAVENADEADAPAAGRRRRAIA